MTITQKEKAALAGAAYRNKSYATTYQNRSKRQAQFTVVKQDYKRLSRAAIGRLPKLLTVLGITFRLVAGEVQILNPHRADSHFGSFSVNTKSGRWGDFAVGDARGGDVVSLVAYLRKCRQSEAAAWIRRALGGDYA